MHYGKFVSIFDLLSLYLFLILIIYTQLNARVCFTAICRYVIRLDARDRIAIRWS